MSDQTNAREFTRVPSSLDVDLKTVDGLEITGRIQNLSLAGLFIETDSAPPVGVECSVVLHLGGRGSGVAVRACGRITRADERGAGMRFEEVNYDAMDHLRQLLLYNAVDPDAVDAEIAAHLGLSRRD